MKKIVRIFFLMICLWTLVGNARDLVPRAEAASGMTASEECITFLKSMEGFSKYPYSDYGQFTVGYGTRCPPNRFLEYKNNGISREDADVLLRNFLTEFENEINTKLIDKFNLDLNQCQFDALVSFSFNIGTGWLSSNSTLKDAILKDSIDNDLVYAFSLYCTAGGKYRSGLVTRRLCEANMYLNGVYSRSRDKNFGFVYYDANGGTVTYRVQGFLADASVVPVEDAVRKEDTFLGWYTELNGGTKVTELSSDLTGKTLFARWASDDDSEEQVGNVIAVKVTGDCVNVRSGPGTNYGIVKRVYRNNLLTVSHVTHLTNMKWGKLQDGWICLDYTNYDDVINGTSNENMETNDGDFAKDNIADNNSAGKDIDTDVDVSTDSQKIISGIVNVNDFLKIRRGPGTSYSVVGFLFKNNKVEILEQRTVNSMVWGRITNGWVCMDYIVTDKVSLDDNHEPDAGQVPEQVPEQPEQVPENEGTNDKTATKAITGKITADALRIRSGAGTASGIVGFYFENDTVEITEKVLVESVCWGKTNRGWISMDYVSIDTELSYDGQEQQKELKSVTADCLRIRRGAGTNERIAGFLYYGDKVEVLETKVVDGEKWGRVDRGWICLKYVK